MSEEKIVENTVDTDVKMEEGTKPELNAIPRSRLNEVIEERNTLREEIKSYQLQKEVESLTPFKEKYDSLDGKIRAEALNKLPEQKQEKFKNLNTTDLLNVVEELASKVNPPDNAGTVDRGKISKEAWKSMDINDKRKNWSSILDSYKR